MTITVEAIDHQRNGIGGEPFITAIVRDDTENPEQGRFLIVFVPERDPDTGQITGVQTHDGVLSFVNSLDAAAKGDLSNHWRGDRLIHEWLPAIAKADLLRDAARTRETAKIAQQNAERYQQEGNTCEARKSLASVGYFTKDAEKTEALAESI